MMHGTGKSTRKWLLAITVLALSAALGACASAGTGGSGADREVLTEGDLAPYTMQNAYQVVQRLRGFWLNARTTVGGWTAAATSDDPPTRAIGQGEGEVQVYIDGVQMSDGVEALKTISVREIREIRHMDARDATMQYGTNHGSGAILVSTKSG